MKRIHLLLTLSSLNVFLVIVERISFTTRIFLMPYSFLRLHELLQMTTLILFTVIIPYFLIKEITNNFETLRTKYGTALGFIFLIGVYFYATGNGLHEVASHLFNTFCPVNTFRSDACGSMYVNDYYTGNILYFIGAFLMNIALVFFERIKTLFTMKRKDTIFVIINSLIYAFAIFAYAAFDRVSVGVVYAIMMTLALLIVFFATQRKYTQKPVMLYLTLAYTVGTLASIIVRYA